MFYWKDNGKEDLALGYEGRIYQEGEDDFALAIFRNMQGGYYTWFWDFLAATPKEWIDAINEFIDASSPPFPSNEATILCTNMDDYFNYRKRSVPLQIIDGMFDGIPLTAISSLRIDVPGPAPRPAPTTMQSGESAIIPPLGTEGLSFLFTSGDAHQEVNLGIAAGFVPAESIVEFYRRTTKRTLSADEHASLAAIVADHSKWPMNS